MIVKLFLVQKKNLSNDLCILLSFSCPKRSFSSTQKHFNLIELLRTRVFTFQTGAIKEKFFCARILNSKFNKILYSGVTIVF